MIKFANILNLVLFSLSFFSFLFFASDIFSLEGSRADIWHAKMTGAIGFSAEVPANKYNLLAQELAEKEQSLLERESRIIQDETAMKYMFARKQAFYNKVSVGGFLISVLLLTLLAFNFYFDRKRARQMKGLVS